MCLRLTTHRLAACSRMRNPLDSGIDAFELSELTRLLVYLLEAVYELRCSFSNAAAAPIETLKDVDAVSALLEELFSHGAHVTPDVLIHAARVAEQVNLIRCHLMS